MRAHSLLTALLFIMAIAPGGCRPAGPAADTPDPEPGVALTLATDRARAIEKVRYQLAFDIPASAAEPISGRATIRLVAKEVSQPLVLDFEAGPAHLTSLSIGGKPSRYREVNGHIVIPSEELIAGENVLDLVFRAGDAPLNRNPDFLYTIFVPARAHLAFPSFDQPDLKARYTLELTLPAGWQAVANGAEVSREASLDRVRVRYAETQPIPTYLFAFAAGP